MRHASLLLLATATLLPLATAQSPKEELREAIRQIVREEIRAALQEQQEQRAKAPRQLTILDAKSGEQRSLPVEKAGKKIDLGGVVAEIVELELAEEPGDHPAPQDGKSMVVRVIKRPAGEVTAPEGFVVVDGQPLVLSGNVDLRALGCTAEAGQPVQVELRKTSAGATEGGEMAGEVAGQTEGCGGCCPGSAAATSAKRQRIEVVSARPVLFRLAPSPAEPAAPTKKAKQGKPGKKAKKKQPAEGPAASPVLEIGQLGS